MKKVVMDGKWLTEYSGEHLMHELSMLWELAEILPKQEQGTALYTAVLESFANHLRNLIEFFGFPTRMGYVRAQDFFDDPAAWPARCKLTSILRNGLSRANEEVAHLTTGRKSGSPPEKVWYVHELLKEVEKIAKEFASNASPERLHPSVREFLGLPSGKMHTWVRANVIHSSNVASCTAFLTSDGASTATTIIHKTLTDP